VRIHDYVSAFYSRFPFLDPSILPWHATAQLPSVVERLAASLSASGFHALPTRFPSTWDAGRKAGHSPDRLKVGVHALGYVADTTQQAADEFWPGYARAFTDIGKERGWPPATRAGFDAQRGPHGALLIGNADEVAEKIIRHSETLGGISRISFQMNAASLPHAKLMRAIEMLGTRVEPALREKEVAGDLVTA
jgi:alkanesulfonate monooxygenase SsuD/methylene tetrahydromethanopterin reductase-like flavin-dependent oxidoreductase (luciferase family)